MTAKKTSVRKKKKPAKPRDQPSQRSAEALDGCSGHIGEHDATPDEDLPAADGGVARHGL